jgi:DnaJ-class molecular chaperone
MAFLMPHRNLKWLREIGNKVVHFRSGFRKASLGYHPEKETPQNTKVRAFTEVCEFYEEFSKEEIKFH